MTKQADLVLRYRLQDGGNINPWLEHLSLKSTSRIVDEYFDILNNLFYQKGILIILRNDDVLEIKCNPNHRQDSQSTTPLQCRKYHFPVNKNKFDPKQIEEFNELEDLIGLKRPRPFSFSHFLGGNKLRSFIVLDKTRKTYETPAAPHIRIYIDRFNELGTFVEFEGQTMNAPYPTDDFWKDVQKLIADLPLAPFNTGFIELALDKAKEGSNHSGHLIGS